ncbi:acetyl-CoA C-acyltransferase [Nakamurella antarctica]|uniref:Acetyl-CoA C-acyltransferase n=1 Tax=Nakamurella antarctica TaxID=1902245 RepID=A0A3G8ZJL0_9ACTN|nr:acetyl-CoA C-acyltransferase [Nakamurella antarctica]AZI57378.1 acetyl-CoA C-acyltransferase [Nakamurella antarctica]
MRDAVIVEAVRTAVGRRKGSLAHVHAADLSAVVLRALIGRTHLDPALIDDVIWGCVTQSGDQGANIARTALLSAGWPETVPGVTIDRQCGSSQQAIGFAAAGVIAGHYDFVVAGGVETMTRTPMLSNLQGGDPFAGKGFSDRYGLAPNQGIGAEMIAQRWGLSRTQLDEFAAASHQKAAAAQDSGAFDAQIVAVPTEQGDFSRDEGIRRGTSSQSLAGLKTVFADDGVIHAGNASQISDGSAALLITTGELAAVHGLTPIARVHTAVVAAADPIIMLTAPIPATVKVLQKSGISLDQIGAFEVNEAFAPVPLAWLAEIGANPELMNSLGGAIALGHPLGGSGARIATTLIHHMRDNGIAYGLQTMCEGGGMANATIFELL